jgi:hypothetical protein
MRLLVSMCSRTDEAPECLVLCDPDRLLIQPIAVPNPAFGAFGLCLTSSTVYTVFDLGRPVEEQPERSELRALDRRRSASAGGTRSSWVATSTPSSQTPVGCTQSRRGPTSCCG